MITMQEIHEPILSYENAQHDDTLDEVEKRNVESSHITGKVFKKFNPDKSVLDVFNKQAQ